MEFYESFMKFSFPDDDLFRIEEDPLVKDRDGVVACECVVLINSQASFIEAKSSSPKKETNQKKIDQFIEEIKQKFESSISLFNDIKSQKFGEEAFLRLPINLRENLIDADNYLVYLIVHGHRIEWLVGLQDAFRDVLRDAITKWGIKDSNIKVFNEEVALEKRLIVAFVPKEKRDSLREPNGNMSIELVKQWFDNN